MKTYNEVVNNNTILAAKTLSRVLSSDFYLAGGTALALQIGHRISLDLDLFTNLELNTSQRNDIINNLKKETSFKIRENRDGTIHLVLHNTPVSLFHYTYPSLKKPSIKWSSLLLASLQDITAMKCAAIGGRGSKKDFIDLYFLCKHFSFNEVMRFSQNHYLDHTNIIIQTTRALIYFNDADQEPMPKMIEEIDWDKVKYFFTSEVKKYYKKLGF